MVSKVANLQIAVVSFSFPLLTYSIRSIRPNSIDINKEYIIYKHPPMDLKLVAMTITILLTN